MNETLTRSQKEYMYRAGFLIREISAFANAKTPDGKTLQDFQFMSEPVQDMIRARMEYVKKLQQQGWNDLQVRQRINMLYNRKRGKASPWDFLKIEYRPEKKMSDAMWSNMLKCKGRIARTLGSAYSKPTHRELRPRFEARIRELPPQPRE